MDKSVSEVARMVFADAETDAVALDGKPFTGRVVAETFGSTLAMIAALAKCIETLAADDV